LGLFIARGRGSFRHTLILSEYSDGELPLFGISVKVFEGAGRHKFFERHLIVWKKVGWLDTDCTGKQKQLMQGDVLIPALDIGNRGARQPNALSDLTLR
jgi:hypothetical protein